MKLEKKYRILVVIRWPVGGIRTFIRYVYRNFDFRKYSFTIIAPDLPELRILLSDLKGLELSYISVNKNPSNRRFFWKISKVIICGKYDLIHSHGFTAGLCSILGSVLTHTPHMLTLHEVLNDSQFLGCLGFCKKMAMSLLLPFINVIHLVSQDARRNLFTFFRLLKVFKNKLVVIPNGIEVERFLGDNKRDFRKELNLQKNTFLIGYLGRFMPVKGFKYLVDAIAILHKEYSLTNSPVVLAFGEGAFIREEKIYVREKGLGESIYFMPFTPDVSAALGGLDVVAMPSLWEACGLVAIEAMVSGVPLIGTNCIGLREVIKNTPARIIPPQDGKALAEAILQEMETPSKEKMKAFSIDASQRFNVKQRARDIEALIKSLMISRHYSP